MISYVAAFGCILMAIPPILIGAIAKSTGNSRVHLWFKFLGRAFLPNYNNFDHFTEVEFISFQVAYLITHHSGFRHSYHGIIVQRINFKWGYFLNSSLFLLLEGCKFRECMLIQPLCCTIGQKNDNSHLCALIKCEAWLTQIFR